MALFAPWKLQIPWALAQGITAQHCIAKSMLQKPVHVSQVQAGQPRASRRRGVPKYRTKGVRAIDARNQQLEWLKRCKNQCSRSRAVKR